jgi:hypothetical protein
MSRETSVFKFRIYNMMNSINYKPALEYLIVARDEDEAKNKARGLLSAKDRDVYSFVPSYIMIGQGENRMNRLMTEYFREDDYDY